MEVVVGAGWTAPLGGPTRGCGETVAIFGGATGWVPRTGAWRLAERDCGTLHVLIGAGLFRSCERFWPQHIVDFSFCRLRCRLNHCGLLEQAFEQASGTRKRQPGKQPLHRP